VVKKRVVVRAILHWKDKLNVRIKQAEHDKTRKRAPDGDNERDDGRKATTVSTTVNGDGDDENC